PHPNRSLPAVPPTDRGPARVPLNYWFGRRQCAEVGAGFRIPPITEERVENGAGRDGEMLCDGDSITHTEAAQDIHSIHPFLLLHDLLAGEVDVEETVFADAWFASDAIQ